VPRGPDTGSTAATRADAARGVRVVTRRRIRDRAIACVLLFTGLRIAELEHAEAITIVVMRNWVLSTEAALSELLLVR
jgi:integrase